MRIIAHRGASVAAPENTQRAFATAKELGAHAIELDARVCGTGEVVVFHDERLDRLAGAPGRVAETPLAELRKLRVRGEPIPTLDEVLRSDDRPPGLVIEIKTDRWNQIGIAAKVAELVRRTDATGRGPLAISSFNPLLLYALKGIAAHIPRALLAHREQPWPLRKLWLARPVQPRELHLEACMIDAALVARARRAGRFVVAWTVNERAEGERLRGMGVDGVITDVPDVFVGSGG